MCNGPLQQRSTRTCQIMHQGPYHAGLHHRLQSLAAGTISLTDDVGQVWRKADSQCLAGMILECGDALPTVIFL